MRSIALILTTLLLPVLAWSNDNGIAGRTSMSGAGCGDCHGLTTNTSTSVSLTTASENLTMTPGATREFTIVVAHTQQVVAGVGISIRSASDGGDIVGTLVPGEGLQLKGKTKELTHSSPKSMSAGHATFTFSWTAPTTPGVYYLQAIGNAANGDGIEDEADHWSWMTPVAISVQVPSSVAELNPRTGDQIFLAPHPVISGEHTTVHGLDAAATSISILDIAGTQVFSMNLEQGLSGSTMPIDVPPLPSGVYALTVDSRTGRRRTMFVITP